ncbi:MAG: hypothetical protein ISR31_08270 [Luminiphilus sp.]|nr:hypothetical protein [Luminiphilus sp.]
MSAVPVARPYAGVQSLLLAAEPLVRRYEPCEANRFIKTDPHDVPNLTSGIALDSKNGAYSTKL